MAEGFPVDKAIEATPITTGTRARTDQEHNTDYRQNPFYLKAKVMETRNEAARRCSDTPQTYYSLTSPQNHTGASEDTENGLNPFYLQSESPSVNLNHAHLEFLSADENRGSDIEDSRLSDGLNTNYFRAPEDPMETALTCGICLSSFDIEYRRPILLPECGHTFCRSCVKGLELRSLNLYCPACRHEYKNTDVDNFPINFNLEIVASSTKKEALKKSAESGECSAHGVRFAFWCRACEVPVCGECLFEGHPQPTHAVCKIQDVVLEIKARAEEMVRTACQDAKLELAGSVRRVLQGVLDLQEASHILQETDRIARRVPGSSNLPAITSVFEKAKNTKKRVEALRVGGGSGGGGASGGGGGGDGDGSEEGAVGGAPPSPSSYPSPSASSAPSSLGTPLRAGVSTYGRPVVVALSDTGGLAHVRVEEEGIHVYSIQPASTAYSVAVKLSILLGCLNEASPRVFMDIKAGERPLGRIYFKLWGNMRRAQQFLALCLGTYGPCYRDTKFDGVNGRGEPGEYVRGGDYSGKQGLGGEAVMDNLEWGGPWAKPMQAGQVCGVGGEEDKKFGALFAICMRDNPTSTFRAPFGMVTSGMKVLEVACRHDPFGMVRVAECGVVIDL